MPHTLPPAKKYRVTLVYDIEATGEDEIGDIIQNHLTDAAFPSSQCLVTPRHRRPWLKAAGYATIFIGAVAVLPLATGTLV